MYQNFREILQRMIDFMRNEYDLDVTIHDAYCFAVITQDDTYGEEFFMTRENLQNVLEDLNIDAPLSMFIDDCVC